MLSDDLAARPAIAVAITTFNRRTLTLRCLESIVESANELAELTVDIADASSTDGTAQAVSRFSAVDVSSVPSSFYWSAGMEVACSSAIARGADFVLLLNDDVDLDSDAIQRAIASAANRPDSILVGAMRSAGSSIQTYGGLSSARFSRVRLREVQAGDAALPIDTFHGNFVLVPKTAYRVLGPIDGRFVHNYGDLDYGLRATKLGIPVSLMEGTFGVCEVNLVSGTYDDTSLRRSARLREFLGPKGRPIRPHLRFLRRHSPILWPLHLIATYARFMLRVARRR